MFFRLSQLQSSVGSILLKKKKKQNKTKQANVKCEENLNKMAESCLHSKKNCKFDENYSINDKMISLFDLILLRLKKMFLKKSSATHY